MFTSSDHVLKTIELLHVCVCVCVCVCYVPPVVRPQAEVLRPNSRPCLKPHPSTNCSPHTGTGRRHGSTGADRDRIPVSQSFHAVSKEGHASHEKSTCLRGYSSFKLVVNLPSYWMVSGYHCHYNCGDRLIAGYRRLP